MFREVHRLVVYQFKSMMLMLLKVWFVWFLLLCDLRHVWLHGVGQTDFGDTQG